MYIVYVNEKGRFDEEHFALRRFNTLMTFETLQSAKDYIDDVKLPEMLNGIYPNDTVVKDDYGEEVNYWVGDARNSNTRIMFDFIKVDDLFLP